MAGASAIALCYHIDRNRLLRAAAAVVNSGGTAHVDTLFFHDLGANPNIELARALHDIWPRIVINRLVVSGDEERALRVLGERASLAEQIVLRDSNSIQDSDLMLMSGSRCVSFMLRNCPRVTPHGLSFLGSNSTLSSVRFESGPYGDEFVSVIAKNRGVRFLSCRDSQISEASIRLLSATGSLSRLTWLDVSGSRVRGERLAMELSVAKTSGGLSVVIDERQFSDLCAVECSASIAGVNCLFVRTNGPPENVFSGYCEFSRWFEDTRLAWLRHEDGGERKVIVFGE